MSGIRLAETQTSGAGYHRGITTDFRKAHSAFLPVPVERKCTDLDPTEPN